MNEDPVTSAEVVAVLVRAGYRVVAAMNGVTILLVHRGGVPVRVPTDSMIAPEALASILRTARIDRPRFDELLDEVVRADRFPVERHSWVTAKRPVGATG